MNVDALVQAIAGAAAIYAAIRADIAYLRSKVEHAASDSAKAHERLDEHINLHHVK